MIANFIRAFGSLSNGVDDLENFTSEMEWSFFVPVGFMVSGILVKQPPVCLQYLVFPAVAVVHLLHQAYPCIAQRSSDQLYDVEAVDDDPGIRKQFLDELDVLGVQVDNYGFHRSSFPVRVAVHEVLPDCLRQSVFKNSHDVIPSASQQMNDMVLFTERNPSKQRFSGSLATLDSNSTASSIILMTLKGEQ